MSDKNQNIQNAIKPKGLGVRHVQTLLLFLGLNVAIIQRINLSIGIVAMTDNLVNPQFETYKWTEQTKGLILSSFYCGYILTQIPGGCLLQYFSAKLLLLICLFVSSILTIFIPIFAPYGWIYICVMRVIVGLFQGALYPIIFDLMSKWIHPSERRYSSIILTGAQLGSFLMLIVSGEIATSILGWPGIFYISGFVGIVWSIFWCGFGSQSPEKCTRVSCEERSYLENTSGTASNKKLPIPWKKILKSMPFWSVVVIHCAHNWGFFTLLLDMPTYMSEVLNLDIRSNSILSSIPYLLQVIATILLSYLSDFIINNGFISRPVSRKMFSVFAQWTPLICFIGLGFATSETTTLAIILLMLAITSASGINVGFNIVLFDMAPNFTGTLYSITNCFASISAMIGPIYVGLIVGEGTDPLLWRIVFFTAAIFYCIGSFTFLIFGRAELQHWNSGK